MNREDGFYWVKYHDRWEVSEFLSGVWWGTGIDSPRTDRAMDEIGPRVQRDSEIVKQRDELERQLQRVVRRAYNSGWKYRGDFEKDSSTGYYAEDWIEKEYPDGILALIEAEKSGVKP